MALTKAQKALHRRAIEAGGVHRTEDGGYCLPDGSPAHGRVVNNLMAKGLLRESGDALWPAVPSQTLSVVTTQEPTSR